MIKHVLLESAFGIASTVYARLWTASSKIRSDRLEAHTTPAAQVLAAQLCSKRVIEASAAAAARYRLGVQRGAGSASEHYAAEIRTPLR